MVTAYRICQKKYASTAFDGEGARLFGGRWNHKGTPLVYSAESLSLATLELLVHLDDYTTVSTRYCWIPVSLPENSIEFLSIEDAPAGWDNDEPSNSSRKVGNLWAQEKRSLAVRVPSVVTPGEYNFLINPIHPEFSRLKRGKPTSFRLDERLGES